MSYLLDILLLSLFEVWKGKYVIWIKVRKYRFVYVFYVFYLFVEYGYYLKCFVNRMKINIIVVVLVREVFFSSIVRGVVVVKMLWIMILLCKVFRFVFVV